MPPLVLLLSTLLLLRDISCRAQQQNILAFGYQSPSSSELSAEADSYSFARSLRLNDSFSATLHYQALLLSNPNDCAAATRIAASPSSPQRHDRTCPVSLDGNEDVDNNARSLIRQIKHVLHESRYDRQSIGELFGVKVERRKDCFPWGPSYLRAVSSPANHLPPLTNSLSCLVAMFLLGFAVHRSILQRHLLGGENTLDLLESLGLAFPCEMDPSLLVPYVTIFPMDVPLSEGNENNSDARDINKESISMESIFLVTDLHPTVLSRTSLGLDGDGAVMYIGPDSLALTQHLPLDSLIAHVEASATENHSKKGRYVLDLCTGSGIQAISTLAALKNVDPAARAVCLDLNERALKFVRFNAMLNGMEDRVQTVKGDLTSGQALPLSCENTNDPKTSPATEYLIDVLRAKTPAGYDLVLANPPFVPTPPTNNGNENISSRYGLFSSGGSDGEDVLRGIIKMSPHLLSPSGGFLGIVSEFMNPFGLCHKVERWWMMTSGDALSGKGVLYFNEDLCSSKTYAARRANDENELKIWVSHLDAIGIRDVSPGLLFIQIQAENSRSKKLKLKHDIVPKSSLGSIWTPHNGHAIRHTAGHWKYIQELK